MIVYAVATAIACLFAWYAPRCEKRALRWSCMALSALPLFLVAAARWGVGTDVNFLYLPQFTAVEWHYSGEGRETAWDLYRPFYRAKMWFWKAGSPLYAAQVFWRKFNYEEPGYRWLVTLIVNCGGGFRWFLAITSGITSALVFTSIWRQSRYPALAIFFFVTTSNYFVSLNIVRQYIAVALVLLAVEFAVNRRYFSFLVAIACGALFHRTAMLGVLVLPLAFLKPALNPLWGFAAVGAAYLASFVVVPFFRAVLPIIGCGIYLKYFGSKFSRDGFETIFFLINLCFMCLGAWYLRRAAKGNRFVVCWYWMTVVGTMFLALSGVVPLMKRVNYLFAAPQFLMLPELIAAEENRRLRWALGILIVIGFAAETYVAVCVLNKNEPLPYRIAP